MKKLVVLVVCLSPLLLEGCHETFGWGLGRDNPIYNPTDRTIITVLNATNFFLDISQDGKQIYSNLGPGQSWSNSYYNYSNKSYQISLIVVAKDKDNNFIGTGVEIINIYPNERRSLVWQVERYDIR